MERTEYTNQYLLVPGGELTGSQNQLMVKPVKTWKSYLWDTWELPKDQRWLLFKLDAFVLTFASVSPPFSHSLQRPQAHY
jgi:hypothetical protein